jgi:hypothetical protein
MAHARERTQNTIWEGPNMFQIEKNHFAKWGQITIYAFYYKGTQMLSGGSCPRWLHARPAHSHA